jgi:hypothetical protein
VTGRTYENSVFVNCPFDPAYRPVFEAVTFAVYDCGFFPRCALEVEDGSEVRIGKIQRIIGSCRLAVHDISRTELDAGTGLPRFNMPLELGIFLGAKAFGDRRNRRKAAVILDGERYRYQQYISDIAGQDIRAHAGDPDEAICQVRDFLCGHAEPGRLIAGGHYVVDRYAAYRRRLPDLCARGTLRPEKLTFRDLTNLVVGWIAAHPKRLRAEVRYTRSSSATGKSRKRSARRGRSPSFRSAPVNTSR